MRSLVTTAAGLRATVRSMRWSPLVVTPMVASVALMAVHAVADPTPGRMSVVGDAGLTFTAATAAFIADDASLDAAPATPIEARARLVARAAVALPVAAVAWLLVLALYNGLDPARPAADLAGRALNGAGLSCSALALAVLGGRLRFVASPGAAGVGAMASLGVAWQILPAAWLRGLPPAAVLWPAAIVLALITVAMATQEPAT